MHSADLTSLLEQVRAKNARLNVTGLLVFHGREFMQVLEVSLPTNQPSRVNGALPSGY